MTSLQETCSFARLCGSFVLRTGLTLSLVSLCPAAGAADGWSWESGLTTVYQVADDDRVDPEFTASADLFLTFPMSSGEWLIYIEASTAPDADGVSSLYPTSNADAGSVLTRDGDHAIQVSEFNYTFFLDGGKRLMLGLIDPSAWLDRSRIANDENLHFLNGSFVQNATIEFPDYTLGGVFRLLAANGRPEISIVAGSSEGIADLPDRSYQDLLDLTASDRGAFIGAGASWLYERASFRLGAWGRTDKHEVGSNPLATERNYGAYAVAGLQYDVDAFNFRLGFANSDVSIATNFVALSWERKTSLGLFGAGISRTGISDDFRQGGLDDTTDAEIFLRVPVASGRGHITPSIQYVTNPGFDASGATASASAFIAGVRFRWSFSP